MVEKKKAAPKKLSEDEAAQKKHDDLIAKLNKLQGKALDAFTAGDNEEYAKLMSEATDASSDFNR